MRIRQVKPAFWSDKIMAGLPKSTRLVFIGLWMMADDAGWIESFDVAQAGAELFPFEPVTRRERELAADVERLATSGRVIRHPCGCIHVPHLEEHQRLSGVRTFRARDAHATHDPLSAKQEPLSHTKEQLSTEQEETIEHEPLSAKQEPLSHSPGRVGYGRERGRVPPPTPPSGGNAGGEHADDDGRADLEAWLLVRRRPPTERQRAFLDAYCRTFDLTGPKRAERLILEHPDDPIGALKADLDEFRKARLAEAKAAERKPAPSGPRRSNGLSPVNVELARLLTERYAAEAEPKP